MSEATGRVRRLGAGGAPWKRVVAVALMGLTGVATLAGDSRAGQVSAETSTTAAVRVWEEPITLPTYRVDAPDLNPMFFKGEKLCSG